MDEHECDLVVEGSRVGVRVTETIWLPTTTQTEITLVYMWRRALERMTSEDKEATLYEVVTDFREERQ